jgi:hypothetical protein
MAGIGGAATPEKIATKEKHRRALELRKAGLTYQVIADQIGYRGPSTVHAAVMRELREICREPAEELRTLELERLDRLWAGVWTQAKQGHLGSIDRCLRILERRARLLGLDAPLKVELPDEPRERRATFADGSPMETDASPAER